MASACGKGQSESRQFCRSPQLHLYHACEHSARKSRADSCTHCLHARIIGLAGVDRAKALTGWSEMLSFIAVSQGSYKTGNFAHVEKRGKIINSLWKSLLKTLIYNGFRILLFQGGKKTLFLNFYKNYRKTRHFSLFPIKRENLH